MKHFAQKLICLLLVLCMVMTMLPAALAEETVFEPEIPAAETQQAEAPAEVPAEIPAEVPAEVPAAVPAEVPAEVPAAVPAEVPAEPELPEELPLFDEFVDPFTLTLVVPEAYQHMKVQLYEGFFMGDKMENSIPVALPEKNHDGNYVLTLEKSYIQDLNGMFHYIIREDDSDLWSNYIPCSRCSTSTTPIWRRVIKRSRSRPIPSTTPAIPRRAMPIRTARATTL